jgi:hypothetical protein
VGKEKENGPRMHWGLELLPQRTMPVTENDATWSGLYDAAGHKLMI